MADNVIRKACDRCHLQKLCCKRIADEACERCVRLHAECKSNQAGSLTPQNEELATTKHGVAAPGAALDPGEFGLSFAEIAFLTPPHLPDHHHHLSVIPGTVDSFHSPFPEPWEAQLGSTPEASYQHSINSYATAASGVVPSFQQTSVVVAPSALSSQQQQPPPPPPPPEVPTERVVVRRQRFKQRRRPRQIQLRQVAPHQPSASQRREAPTVHWMAQLSDINKRLLELSSMLPQPLQRQQQCNNGNNNNGWSTAAEEANDFPIDEMFKLTRKVADILDGLSSRSGPGSADYLDGSDPGNSMFVLSTYVRLLDMYQRVFYLVRDEVLRARSEAAFRFWKLPDVTVGSFAVESMPSLQMSLTIQLAEEFLNRLRGATLALDPALRKEEDIHHHNHHHHHQTGGGKGGVGGGANGAADGDSMFSDVVDVSYRAVRDKEESLARHLTELRDDIEALLDG
ncbi:hypothetical protein CP532_2236 [Ophiocordyceps camponoti-leonardi (nom. inval.)]|nr:hypothetical protein CP532_2236 [Ophiocordyceps camponoti-leonardi (nom. inval.)]